MYVLCAFAFKLVIVLAVARALRPRCPDALGAFLGAWVLATAASFAAMFALSAVNALTRGALWALLGAAAFLCLVLLRRRGGLPAVTRGAKCMLVLFGAFFAAFGLRALLFQDFTLDAQTYGLVRIGLWMHYGTVFVQMPSPQVNVFANEWNGELLGLFYAIAAGNLQGPVFANVEVLLVTFIACGWFARLLGASWTWAFIAATMMALCPAMLGIATTVKGDLLAVGAFVMALGWLLTAKAGRGWYPVAMLAGCLALAVGAKITVVVPALVAAALAAVLVDWRVLLSARSILASSALATLFLARYAANAIVYGNPVMRVAAEKVEPGVATLVANLAQIWQRAFEFSMHDPGGPQFAYQISGGLGLAGIVAAGATACLLIRRRRVPALLLGGLTVALLITCFVTPARPWSFRYFLPPIVVMGVIIVALAEPARAWLAVLPAVAIGGVNVSYLAWPGELNGNGSFSRALHESQRKSPLERTFLAHDARRVMTAFDVLRLDRGESLTVHALQEVNTIMLPFLGSRAQHRLVLFESQDALVRSLRQSRPHIAVVTIRYGEKLPEETHRAVGETGYVVIESNEWMAIAVRPDLPEARRR